MEETLTNCLLGTRDDLTELQRVREYLDSNTESQAKTSCSVSWRTIEAFNSILAACASQDSPDIQALDTLLDSLYYVACNNEEETVWNNFGFELGVISVKILSTIEQTNMFDVLFCKFLTVIYKICQHNSDAWKAVGRQILNVFINKKFGYSYLESVIKVYVAILRSVDSFVLYNFAQQNHHLLKTMSMIVQRVGDFETQMDILEIVFLHVSSDKKLMEGFFMETGDEVRKLFQKLQFIDFEKDSRTYINALNESLGIGRKVYSIRCKRLLLGGIHLEPPVGRETIWIDANNDSERLTIKCCDFSDPNESVGCCVVYIQFPDIVSVKIEQEVISQLNYYRLTIKTKNLKQIYERVKSDDVICCTDFSESVSEFNSFLEKIIRSQSEKDTTKKEIKSVEKLSQTCDLLFIDRSLLLKNPTECESSEVQDNSISSSIANKKSGIRRIIPDALSLLEKIENNATEQKINSNQIHSEEKISPYFRDNPECQKLNSSQKDSLVLRSQNRNPSPMRNEKARNVVLESQELTPNSFVESLNKNLGLDSPEVRNSFEDSLETVKFVSENMAGGRKSHKLFRSPNKIFTFLDCPDEAKETNFVFEKDLEDKENIQPNDKNNDFKLPVNQVKRKKPKKKAIKVESSTTTPNLRERTSLEIKLTDSQSEKYFRSINSSYERKKKPSLPKLKRASNRTKKTSESENDKKTTAKSKTADLKVKVTGQVKGRRQSKPTETPAIETVKSSLLDPNGYAFQRWLKPTTSERSNFWLKKLNENPKEKIKSSHVFDYSEESDSEVKKTVRKGRYRKSNSGRVILTTKRKRESRKSKKEESSKSEPPLKQVKNILKSRTYPKLEEVVKTDKTPTTEKSKDETGKGNQKPKDDVQLHEKSFHESSCEKSVLRSSLVAKSPEVEEKLEETCLEDSNIHSERIYDNIITRRSSTDESFYNEEEIKEKEPDFFELQKEDKSEEEKEEEEEEEEEDEDEIFSLSEDDTIQPEEPKTNKRERSDEENSLTKAFIKKKAKTQKKADNRFLPTALETKLREREKKLKQETDEIIETVKKATNQLLGHFQKKQTRGFVSYLTSAKEAGSELVESDESRIRIKRLERVVAYLKAGSSVSEICDAADGHLERIRKALKGLVKSESDNSKKIERFNDRLKCLIENAIDKSVRREYLSKRNRLLRCASIFGSKLGG